MQWKITLSCLHNTQIQLTAISSVVHSNLTIHCNRRMDSMYVTDSQDSDHTVNTVCLSCGWDEKYSVVNLRGIKDPQISHCTMCCRHREWEKKAKAAIKQCIFLIHNSGTMSKHAGDVLKEGFCPCLTVWNSHIEQKQRVTEEECEAEKEEEKDMAREQVRGKG